MIEQHVKVASNAGAVWWGRLSYSGGRAGLSPVWQQQLRDQLRIRTDPTFIYLHSAKGGTWRARLLDVTTERRDVEESLIPPYYDTSAYYSLWVKLTDFFLFCPEKLLNDYVMARTGEPISSKGLNNQTPLIVRRLREQGGVKPQLERLM